MGRTLISDCSLYYVTPFTGDTDNFVPPLKQSRFLSCALVPFALKIPVVEGKIGEVFSSRVVWAITLLWYNTATRKLLNQQGAKAKLTVPTDCV